MALPPKVWKEHTYTRSVRYLCRQRSLGRPQGGQVCIPGMMKAVVGRWVLCTVLSVVTTWTLTSPAVFPFVLLTTSISALLSITLPGHRARHCKIARQKSSWVQVQT